MEHGKLDIAYRFRRNSQTLVKYTRKREITRLRVYFTMSGNQTSLVSHIKTEFRSSLSIDKVSSLIGYHFNKCCELSLFDESLLAKGKSCIY